MRVLLLALFLLVGCASQQKEPVVMQTTKIQEFVHKEITPVALPEAFDADVKEHVDGSGKVWALVDPAELYKIEQAYISAESNAALVEQANSILQLTVQRANLIRELAILEEIRANKAYVLLDMEIDARREEQLRNQIESISLKILAALALAVAI